MGAVDVTGDNICAKDIALIGLDWGSTNVRAYAFSVQGDVIDVQSSQAGALTLSGANAFDAALRSVVRPWIDDTSDIPLIACGMVGAKHGWREVGYCLSGVGASELARNAVRVETSLGSTLAIIPGIKSAEPDVMRGEETQLIGCELTQGVVILPGTHSKWVELRDGAVASFATFMTGELNALIRTHSSVGALLKSPPNASDLPAFNLGVNYARAGAASWLHDLFVLRASVVSGHKREDEISTVLAGWLLGCEFAAGLSMYPNTNHVSLIASANVLPWYTAVASSFNVVAVALDASQVTPRGLWKIGQMVTK